MNNRLLKKLNKENIKFEVNCGYIKIDFKYGLHFEITERQIKKRLFRHSYWRLLIVDSSGRTINPIERWNNSIEYIKKVDEIIVRLNKLKIVINQSPFAWRLDPIAGCIREHQTFTGQFDKILGAIECVNSKFTEPERRVAINKLIIICKSMNLPNVFDEFIYLISYCLYPPV